MSTKVVKKETISPPIKSELEEQGSGFRNSSSYPNSLNTYALGTNGSTNETEKRVLNNTSRGSTMLAHQMDTTPISCLRKSTTLSSISRQNDSLSERVHEDRDSINNNDFRNSMLFNRNSTSSTSSNSTNSRGVWLSALYKSLTETDIPDEEVDRSLMYLDNPKVSKEPVNETKAVEKLKMHLIYQQKFPESKTFYEHYHKLKTLNVVKNKTQLIEMMYALFDKEETRAKLNANQKVPKQEQVEKPKYPNTEQKQRSNPIDSSKVDFRRCKSESSSSKIKKEIRGSFQDGDFTNELPPEFQTPVDFDIAPNLSLKKESDHLISKEINNVPSISSDNGKYLYSQIDDTTFKPVDSQLQAVSAVNSKNSNSHRTEILSKREHSVSLRENRKSQIVAIPQPFPEYHSRVVEREIIQDLIYVFQGIDGKIIKSTSDGNYSIASKKYDVDMSLQLQALRLCELGFFFKKIRNFCNKPSTGLIVQGLKIALEKELQEYYRLLAVIQGQVQQYGVETPVSDDVSHEDEMTLLRLTVWVYDCRPRFELLASMLDGCEGKKGGELCSVLFRYTEHGDPLVSSLTITLLSVVAKPLYEMLCQWILYGELEDPYNEFFIASDNDCKPEHLWHSKYNLRKKMLPSFISMDQAERILATGKNINFLMYICKNSSGYEGRNSIKITLENSPVECLFMDDDKVLNKAIVSAYQTTSDMVLKVLIEESRLLHHLNAIKHYLLLGQGDFIQYLLELIREELSKPANKLYTHNLSSKLESAIRATNAQFEEDDILCRLDTRILPSSDKDLGWDVFCLDYKAHGPIGTVLTEDVMISYNKLFNALWRAKRIETILSYLWKNQTALFKYQRIIPEIGPVLHRSQLLISEMIHFVHQTQYYIMFEATECAWEHLINDLNKARDLDEVIKAHNIFLRTITKRSLLDPESRDLLNKLRGIFDVVHQLKGFLIEFDEKVADELNSRNKLKRNSIEDQKAQKAFFMEYIAHAKGTIEALYTTNQDLVRDFLLVLNRQVDITLQCLSFRLDFNEYYHFKDARLGQPLTLSHRRLSNHSPFNPMNMSMTASGMNLMLNSTSISESTADEDTFMDIS